MRNPAPDRIAFVDALDDLLPCLVVNNLSANIETSVVDCGLLGDADSGKLMHLADVGEFHIIAKCRNQCIALDDFALVIARFCRGIAPYLPLLGVNLGKGKIDFHSVTGRTH
jgi:hypothetical protein